MPRLRDTSGTERYEIGIPEVGMPSPRAQGAGNELSFGSSNAQSVGNLGKAFEGLSLAIRAREDEYDKSKVEYANNEYQRWLLDYTNNPETGLFNARKGYDAIMDNSVLGDFDKESLKMKDSLAKKHKMNKNQLALWNQVAPRTALPYYEQAQNYEQKEYAAFKQQNLETHIANGTEAILAAPLDPLVFATFKEQLAGYLQVEYGHVSDETFAQMYETQVSAVEQQRIASIAIQDPLGAYAIMEKSKDLTPQDKTALRKTLQEEVDMVKRQQTAAKFFAQYPNDPTRATREIRAAHPGSEGEGIIQSYMELANEADATENKVRAETSRMQQENYDNLWIANFSEGVPVDQKTLKQMYESGQISASHYRGANAQNLALMTKEGLMKKGWLDPDADFANKTPEQREIWGMQDKNITQEARQEAVSYLREAIMRGVATPQMIIDFESESMITKLEKENMLGIMQEMKGKLGIVAEREKVLIENQLTQLFGNSALYSIRAEMEIKKAMEVYNEKFLALDSRDDAIQFPEDLLRIRQELMLDVYNGVKASGYAEPVALGNNYEALNMDEQTPNYYTPEFYVPDIYLRPRELRPPTTPGDFTNSPSVAMVEGGRAPGPNADRGVAKTGDANAAGSIDIPAKLGAQINGLNFPFDLILTEAHWSESGGNMKVYKGTDNEGNEIRFRYLHLESLGGAQVGDKLTAQSVVGWVGDTGRSRGPHLHFDLTVNGEWTNPDTYMSQYISPLFGQFDPMRDDLGITTLMGNLKSVLGVGAR